MSLLSYENAVGVFAAAAIVSVVGNVGAFQGVVFSHTGTLINFSGLPVYVDISAFCFGGHALFPNINRSMKNQQHFTKGDHEIKLCRFIIQKFVHIWVLDKRSLIDLRLRAGISKAAEDAFLYIVRADAAHLMRLMYPGVVRVIQGLDLATIRQEFPHKCCCPCQIPSCP
ncbi:hypothetical protein R1sor_000439 [Riccia sorocarpa]|uniref:Amino acid transporter transmembrane domain-containing protein n=1 Tax=Riccia sorocarpa TaxID=122646 RepID=A0ABD3GW63_9MARC